MVRTLSLTIIFLFSMHLLGVDRYLYVKVVGVQHSIKITGDEKYRKQVESCLDLLALKSPDEYRFVEKNIGVIAQHSKSGMRAWEEPPKYEMSSRTAFYSVSWCASTIAHDAFHSFLYKENLPDDGTRTPYEKWAGMLSEKEAIEFQLVVMKNLGGPRHEIEYLETLDGTHGDVNGDGRIPNDDYKKRYW